MPRGKLFTTAEDEYIKVHAGNIPAPQIIATLNRSKCSVYKRAKILGVDISMCRNHHFWTTGEDKQLIEYIKSGKSSREISEIMGMTFPAIVGRRVNLKKEGRL